MALNHAILACLIERPMSGYDLARYFDASIGFFWRASHPQIYRELGKLRDAGEVSSCEIMQSGKPNRVEYSITPSGRAMFRAWSRLQTQPPAIKDDLLVRLYALDEVDEVALREQLLTRLAQHRDRLKRYERIRASRFAGPDPVGPELGKLIGLDLGIKYEGGWAEWCQDSLERLSRAAETKVVPIESARKGETL